VESINELTSPPPGAASGRKWRIKAAHIRPNARRGTANATSRAVVKLASAPSDRRLAMRRVPGDICASSAQARISRSKALYAMSMHTKYRGVKPYRGGREPGAGNPCGRKGQERHHEEMDEVDPYQ
jgi:hypothetical protein